MTIKGLHFVAKRKPGKPIRWYVYAWRGGPLIKSTVGGPRPALDAEDVALYHDAVQATRKVQPTMFAALVRDYRKSEEWKKLAPTTQRQWGIRLDLMENRWGETPLTIWSDPRMVAKLVKWRDEAASTPREADYRVTVLRSLLAWGRLRSRVLTNVAAGIPKLYEGANRAEIVWTEEDLAKIAEHARPDVMDALRLAALTGLRRTDLLELTWDQVGPKVISRPTNKSKRKRQAKATVPMYKELSELLDKLRTRPRSPGVDTVLVTVAGAPWGPDNFSRLAAMARDKADIRHSDGRKKTPHDMRGTFATKLILAGLTDQEAAQVLAWAPERVGSIRAHYVDEHRVMVHLAERIAAGTVNPSVNRKG